MKKRRTVIPVTVAAVLLLAPWISCQRTATSIQRPGQLEDGSVLLPNRWLLTPAGEQISVDDLPLALALSPDEVSADGHQWSTGAGKTDKTGSEHHGPLVYDPVVLAGEAAVVATPGNELELPLCSRPTRDPRRIKLEEMIGRCLGHAVSQL